MKKLSIKTILVTAATLFLAAACEEDFIMFNSSENLVGFSSSTLTIPENQGSASQASVYFGAAAGTSAVTVTLAVDTTGLGASAAKEGVDFSVSTKSLSVEVGEASVNITPVNNDVFTGNKKFYLVITSATGSLISKQDRVLVTISDDEHPLKSWIGNYKVEAISYGNPGGWDEEWTVKTSAVEGHLDQLSVTGLGSGSTEPLIITIDKNALTVTIDSGQELGEAYGSGNGPVSLYFGTDAIVGKVLSQEEITSQMLGDAAKVKITGTVSANGTIYLDKMALVLTDYNWCWDVFNTTWHKQ